MTLQILDVEQGSEEWDAARRGMVTASVVGKLITPTLKIADNDTSRAVTLQLIAERITGYTEPTHVSADMERGTLDEPLARDHYSEHVAPVSRCGFMVREIDGIRYGFSPDGLVGEDGLIEVKSRKQKIQLETVLTNKVPDINIAQCQMGLMVSGRKWIDYVSWCGGMPMWVIRVLPDPLWFDAIRAAVEKYEKDSELIIGLYSRATHGLPDTDRELNLFEEIRV